MSTSIEDAARCFATVASQVAGRPATEARPRVGPVMGAALPDAMVAWYAVAAPHTCSLPWYPEYLCLFDPDDLEIRQRGYAYNATNREPSTAWELSWICFGDCSGDPLIAHVDAEDVPVSYALHGQGSWSPVLVANTLSSFLGALAITLQFRMHAGLQWDPVPPGQRQGLVDQLVPRLGDELARRWALPLWGLEETKGSG